MMTDRPVPETKTVKLYPDLRDRDGKSVRVRRVTTHRYSHTEERGEIRDVSYVHIFRCSETGASRAYGVEGPNSPGVGDEDLEQPDALTKIVERS